MNVDSEESDSIALLLKQTAFKTQFVAAPSEIKKVLKDASFLAILIDIDSAAVDNRYIKDLASQFPTIPLLCISKDRFHPELKDSIRDHIYACLTKPIDPDELNYWLRCIREDDQGLTVG